jgi:hypothetical protein
VNVPGASINLILTDLGDFKARLTWVNLRRLGLVRGTGNTGSVTVAAPHPIIGYRFAEQPNERSKVSAVRAAPSNQAHYGSWFSAGYAKSEPGQHPRCPMRN